MADKKDDVDRLAGYTVVQGQFGSVRPEIRLAFPYFGEVIRVHPQASDIGWTKFLESVSHMDETQVNDMEALQATMNYVRQQIHPDDWDLFWSTSEKNAQNSMDLVATAKDIVAVVAGFPTGQPADSNRGPQPTDHLSRGGSRRERRAKKSKGRRVDAQRRVLGRANESGRSDLALNALEQYEATVGRRLSIVDGQVVAERSTFAAPESATA